MRFVGISKPLTWGFMTTRPSNGDFGTSLLAALCTVSARGAVHYYQPNTAVIYRGEHSGGGRRHGTREFLRFLGIASGSLAETETVLIPALRLQMAESGQIELILLPAQEVGRMLNGLKRSLRSKT